VAEVAAFLAGDGAAYITGSGHQCLGRRDSALTPPLTAAARRVIVLAA
jgi:hypothetical protein